MAADFVEEPGVNGEFGLQLFADVGCSGNFRIVEQVVRLFVELMHFVGFSFVDGVSDVIAFFKGEGVYFCKKCLACFFGESFFTNA